MLSEITIVEIKRRAEQGVTRPFLCRGDNGRLYWVKGNGAGKLALCREWIAGRIAQLMDLPIPNFAQVHVPRDLIAYSDLAGCQELGAGVAFGSEHVEGACDLLFSDVERVPQEVRLKTLFFDWLVQNGDRTLGEAGGNVNILWLETEAKACIIDHNLAFDAGFELNKWRNDHVFHAILDVSDRQGIKLALGPLRDAMIGLVDVCWSELPDEWLEALNNDFTLAMLHETVNKLEAARSIFGEWVS